MSTRLAALGAPVDGDAGAHATASLYAAYVKAGGDRRTTDALRAEGAAKIERLRARGYDVGYGHDAGYAAPSAVELRLEAIYAQARHALYASAGRPRAAGRRPGTRERPDARRATARTTSPTRDRENRFATTMRSGSSRLAHRAVRGARRCRS